jgi:CRISPR-associated protein Cse2 (CRISPR_cse2).
VYPKDFLNSLFQIQDPGRLANLKRIFGSGGSEIGGLKILAQLSVKVSDQVESIPYKTIAFIYGRKIPNAEVGNIASSLRHAARIKEAGSDTSKGLSFDKRFDMLVSSRNYVTLKDHLIRIIPFLDEYPINYEYLLKDLLNWSADTRDKWIESYYQS